METIFVIALSILAFGLISGRIEGGFITPPMVFVFLGLLVGRWGLANRIKRCLATIELYGGAARTEIPRLRQLEEDLAAKRWKPEKIEALGIADLIREIEADEEAPVLRSLR